MSTREINKRYQECGRCLMDTTDPLIEFDSKGICNHCTEFLAVRSKHMYTKGESEKKFMAEIEAIKKAGKGKQYDCVAGMSGGVDSSYVAYLCKQHGLRVLGVHMDNGWNAEEANLNIKNITNKLGIDYESYVLDWNEFKDLQLSFLKASVPEAELPTDVAITGALHRVAAKYNIKYIISGGNMATEGILPKAWQYNAHDDKYMNAIHDKFGKRKLKNFPSFPFFREMYYKLVKGIKIVYILNHIPYVKEDAMELLKNEVGWKYYGGKHYESKYTRFVQSYYMFVKFPIDYRRATFSSQVLTDEIKREDAIKELQTIPYKPEEVEDDKKYVAKKLGISVEEMNEILALPPKFYFDYPNSEGLLKLVYNTYRKIKGKDKLGSF